MSRNSPNGQAAARAPQRRQPTEQDAYDPYGAQQQAGYPPAGQYQGHPQGGYWSQPQQGYAEAPRYPEQQPSPYAPQHAPYGQQAAPYGQQPASYGQSQPDPYGESAYGGYGAQPGYGSQPYTPMIPAPHPFGQPQGYSAREAEPHRGYAPQAPSQPMSFDHGAASQPQSYAGQPAPGSWQPQQQAPAHDARGFDLSQYSPPSGDPGFQAQPADHFGVAPQDQFDGAQQPEFGDPDAAYDEGEAEEDEPPRTGRRMMMIAAALVGAIGIGGAMAYTYKTVFAGSRGGADKVADLKTKPGKEVSVSEKRLISRLDDVPPGTEPESTDQPSDDPNAPKKVRIIPMPGNASPTETAAAPAAPMPGIMLDMGPQPQRPPPPGATPPGNMRAQMPAPPASNAGTRPATAPVRTVSVNPPAQPSDAPPAAAAPVPKKERVKAEKAPVPRSSDDQTASITPSAGSSGYVAVLASKKSRMDALKAFADLQQNHNDVLGTKTPDVQEANLGDKGMWYRAVVGPPGSREAAANICGALKSAGYNGCWVAAY